jgi:hypothetical protein
MSLFLACLILFMAWDFVHMSMLHIAIVDSIAACQFVCSALDDRILPNKLYACMLAIECWLDNSFKIVTIVSQVRMKCKKRYSKDHKML